VENVQTDTEKPVDSISGPHNSDDGDSSLKANEHVAWFIGTNDGRSLLPPTSGWSLGLKASYPRKANPKVSRLFDLF
jgi:hypothetical protein